MSDTFAGFPGFGEPRTTQVPDLVFDRFMADLTGGELKVLLYIIRRTYGFGKTADNISLSQLQHGITKRDGEVLDKGTGLSKKTLLKALDSLEAKGLIISQRRRSTERGDEPTCYMLRMAPGEESKHPVGDKVHQGGGGESTPGPSGRNSPTQHPVPQETDYKKTVRQRTAPSRAPDPNRMSKEEQIAYYTGGKLGHLVKW